MTMFAYWTYLHRHRRLHQRLAALPHSLKGFLIFRIFTTQPYPVRLVSGWICSGSASAVHLIPASKSQLMEQIKKGLNCCDWPGQIVHKSSQSLIHLWFRSIYNHIHIKPERSVLHVPVDFFQGFTVLISKNRFGEISLKFYNFCRWLSFCIRCFCEIPSLTRRWYMTRNQQINTHSVWLFESFFQICRWLYSERA